MKVILPMAGRGSRFLGSESNIPKPFIPVHGKPMFEWALMSLDNVNYSELIIITLREYEEKFQIKKNTLFSVNKVELVLLDDFTDGQLSTVLAAKNFINTNEDMLIISSDTIVISDIGDAIKNKPEDCHGIISAADMPGDRWSFARTDMDGRVDKVSEKVRISNYASTGLYYFSSGKEFVNAGEEIIQNHEKMKGEYYVIPAYQKYIEKGWHVRISEAKVMWDMGTPDSLANFLENYKVS